MAAAIDTALLLNTIPPRGRVRGSIGADGASVRGIDRAPNAALRRQSVMIFPRKATPLQFFV
jgi:hypothetical protein